uniref:hypothetical protein n=1 Tax=Isoptericola croceus TaxID=3031406 RepID=UPI0023F722B9
VAGLWRDAVRLYDTKTWELVLELPSGQRGRELQSVGFSPDGMLLVAADSRSVRIWRVPDGAPAKEHGMVLQLACFDPSGSRLVGVRDDR